MKRLEANATRIEWQKPKKRKKNFFYARRKVYAERDEMERGRAGACFDGKGRGRSLFFWELFPILDVYVPMLLDCCVCLAQKPEPRLRGRLKLFRQAYVAYVADQWRASSA